MTINASSAIHPFTVAIPDVDLDDLRTRLGATRFPAPLPGDDWDTGVPLTRLRELVADWAAFDWRRFEARLNTVPQFTTEIAGQTIHFAHVRSAVDGAVPLLLTHGWPGSYLEFLDLIGPLTDPAAHGGDPADAFDVIIPSIPGFGFSTPLAVHDTATGWDTAGIAAAWVELMNRLGYDRFAVQGGDLGAGVAPEIARQVPERVIGVHVNGTLSFAAEVDDPDSLTALERDRLARVETFMQNEFGYIAVQSTRPGLVGVALTDSPVAQLAWMFDKLRAWSWPLETDPVEALGADFVFGNLALYWFTASAGSAAFVGYAQDGEWGPPPPNSGVPTAAVQFAHDIGIRQVAEQSHTIVRWTDVEDRGGHFAALEEPELLVEDVRAFLRPLRAHDSA